MKTLEEIKSRLIELTSLVSSDQSLKGFFNVDPSTVPTWANTVFKIQDTVGLEISIQPAYTLLNSIVLEFDKKTSIEVILNFTNATYTLSMFGIVNNTIDIIKVDYVNLYDLLRKIKEIKSTWA